MSLSGFKKQLNKANQLFSEKMTGAHGTEKQEDFRDMERKVDVAGKMVEELIGKTQEYLQPNPMARARLSAVRGFNNLQSKNRATAYPQPEGVLGECMLKHGKDFGSGSTLGTALIDSGDAYKRMSDIKDILEESVKQSFLEPFASLQQRDLREINHHLKKMESRRLDYDCKKRKGGRGGDEDLAAAEEKFVESKNLAETAMVNFLNSDAEHLSALYAFVKADAEYHQQAAVILSDLMEKLDATRAEARNQPKLQPAALRPASSQLSTSSAGAEAAEPAAPTISMKPRHMGAKSATPTCRALYSFTAENNTELAFEEGDIIQLISQVDSNWFEGELKGKRGVFPVTYVDVIVPLP